MKQIKFTTSDVVFLTLQGMVFSITIIECFFAQPGHLQDKINMAIWILLSAGYFLLYKKVDARGDRVIEAADKNPAEIGRKAVSSAPSTLNTYEKGIYEEGFKDGVNYVKNEINSVF